MTPTWTWMLGSSTGTAIAELSTAAGKSISYKRNTFSEAQMTLSHEDTAASLLHAALANDGIPTLRCYRKPDQTSPGVLRFAGYLSAIHEDAEETSLLTAVFRSPFGRLYGNGNDVGRFITSPLPPFVAKDAGQIAKSLIDAANIDSPTRMVAGAIDATKTRDRTYPVGTNVGDAIQNLTSVLDGFDFYEAFVDASLPQAPLPTLASPSFDVDTAGWTAAGAGATITRDTSVFDTAPASGRFDFGAAATLTTTFSGTFLRGVAYRLDVKMRAPNFRSLTFGIPGDTLAASTIPSVTDFTTIPVTWVPKADSTAATITITCNALDGAGPAYVDSVTLTNLTGTIDSTFNVVASQGTDNPNARFEYGPGTLANVQKVSRDWEPPANVIFVVGGNGLTATYTDQASVDKYKKHYLKAEYSDVTEQATLDDKARALVRPYPVRTVSFTPDPVLAPRAFDSYDLGDTVRFFARRGALVDDTPLRINAFTLLVNEEGDEAAEISDPTTPGADAVLRASLTAEILSPPVTPA